LTNQGESKNTYLPVIKAIVDFSNFKAVYTSFILFLLTFLALLKYILVVYFLEK